MDADEILAGVAREVWARDKGGACPEHAIPDYAALAWWIGNGYGDDAVRGAIGEGERRREACIAAIGLEAWRAYERDSGARLADMRARHGVPDDFEGALTGELADYGAELGGFLTVGGPDELWQAAQAAKPDEGIGHPLVPLVRAWQGRARDVEARDVTTLEVQGRARPLRLVRAPAYLDLSLAGPLEAASIDSIEVDGEPFATPQVGAMTAYRRARRARALAPRQLALDGLPGPGKFDGEEVKDVVLATLAEHPLTGDERNPLRGDVVRVAKLAPALSGPTVLTAADGVWFLTRQRTVTEAALKRWNNAMLATSGVRVIVNPRTGQWRSLANVTERGTDGEYAMAPPAWWLEQGGKGPEARWRLTGGLWREPLADDGARGLGRQYWGALERTIDGFEAALCWSRAPMKGKGGRIAEYLRPERRGGPGPAVFVPWRLVLRYSGEYVPDDADAMSTHGRRYRRRVQALEAAGYMSQGGKPAPAGDTVEVVNAQAGTRVHDAGLYVRATARFCEAVASSRRTAGKGTAWTRIPAVRLLRPGLVDGIC